MELVLRLAVGHASILPIKHTADVRASPAPITQLGWEDALCHQADMLLLAVHLCLQVQQPGIAHACRMDRVGHKGTGNMYARLASRAWHCNSVGRLMALQHIDIISQAL